MGDYAQPPMPNVDYSTADDYAPAGAPVDIMPISALSPIEAPMMSPSPSPSPTPAASPMPSIPAITGMPASCDSYFQAVQSQSLNDQVACGTALAVSLNFSFTFLNFSQISSSFLRAQHVLIN
jgi:hypothetical protein